MAELKCVVENCTYNEGSRCCRGDIMVGGRCADTENGTCCESFAARNKDSYKSALSHPGKIISIDCEAVKCIYNSNYKCVAEKVDITGCGACCCGETACATFKEK